MYFKRRSLTMFAPWLKKALYGREGVEVWRCRGMRVSGSAFDKTTVNAHHWTTWGEPVVVWSSNFFHPHEVIIHKTLQHILDWHWCYTKGCVWGHEVSICTGLGSWKSACQHTDSFFLWTVLFDILKRKYILLWHVKCNVECNVHVHCSWALWQEEVRQQTQANLKHSNSMPKHTLS